MTFFVSLWFLNEGFLRTCYLRIGKNEPLQIEKVNGSLCTHIILGFALVRNGIIVPSDPSDLEIYKRAVKFRNSYPDLKIMVSLGGGGAEKGFHEACSNATTRQKLVTKSKSIKNKKCNS